MPKVKVDRNLCIACGACYSCVPEVFQADEEGLSRVVIKDGIIPENLVQDAHDAYLGCPTEAISWEDDK